MNIYVTRDGQNYGPYTPEQAHAMIAQRQLYPGDLACPEGQTQWVPLGQILGIPPQAASPIAAPPPAPVAPAVRPAMPAAPAVGAPLTHGAQPGVPLAQPATALGTTTVPPVAPAGPAPGGPAAHFAIQQAYRNACGAYAKLGTAAALAAIGIGLPAIAWAAGDGGGNALAQFFGETLGIQWAAVAGGVVAALCIWWFFAQKKKAAAAKANFEGMRLAGL